MNDEFRSTVSDVFVLQYPHTWLNRTLFINLCSRHFVPIFHKPRHVSTLTPYTLTTDSDPISSKKEAEGNHVDSAMCNISEVLRGVIVGQ